ncbi:hypothetical protein, partial [Escherichia coli]
MTSSSGAKRAYYREG